MMKVYYQNSNGYIKPIEEKVHMIYIDILGMRYSIAAPFDKLEIEADIPPNPGKS
jgi:hypothetical protein